VSSKLLLVDHEIEKTTLTNNSDTRRQRVLAQQVANHSPSLVIRHTTSQNHDSSQRK